MEKIYIYLLKRTKKDIKIITTLNSTVVIHPTRIVDLDSLGLNTYDLTNIKSVVSNHQLEWETWLETANNYKELRDKLQKRGYDVPTSISAPLYQIAPQELQKVIVAKLNRNRVMIRRAD